MCRPVLFMYCILHVCRRLFVHTLHPSSLTIYVLSYALQLTECTFCGGNKASHHCVVCSFLCTPCTDKIHGHIKHQHHTRCRISKYDANGAALAIEGLFRSIAARKVLKGLAKKVKEGENTREAGPPHVNTKTIFSFVSSLLGLRPLL